MFSGTISSELALACSTICDFSSNAFEGEIPIELATKDGLEILDVSNNMLEGTIYPNMPNTLRCLLLGE